MAAETDQHGVEHPWKGASDGVTLVDFAASWCAPCLKSLPRLEKLAERMPDVRFLIVSVDRREAGRDFLVNELGLTLPVLWDEHYAIAEHYQPSGMPATVVLDSSGAEIYRHVGFSESSWQELVAVLERSSRAD